MSSPEHDGEPEPVLHDILDLAAAEAGRVRDLHRALLDALDDPAQDRGRSGEALRAGMDALADLGARLSLAARQAEQLARANAALASANHDLEQIADVAAHELSEPLRAIAAPISLLARRYRGQLDTDADTYIAYAVEGCRRMRAVIDDLLVYSGAGHLPDEPGPVDLGPVVASALDRLRQDVAESGARVTVGPLPTVRGDGDQLVAVFENLVSNALKFARPGVTPTVEISAARSGDCWQFSVTDNGIGIDPAHRRRVFGVFKRLHPPEEYPGTGIGLAIAKRVVERHGGTIGVCDAPGGPGGPGLGSCFWFTLPAETEPGA